MKKVSNQQLAQALYQVTHGLKGKELESAVVEFAKLLVRAHKIKRANNIIAEFEKYYKKQEGISQIEVISARKLETKTLENIKKAFSAQGGPASGWGGKVEATESIDESLLGGVKVKTEDKILDGSLKTQLNQLKQSII